MDTESIEDGQAKTRLKFVTWSIELNSVTFSRSRTTPSPSLLNFQSSVVIIPFSLNVDGKLLPFMLNFQSSTGFQDSLTVTA